MFQVICLCVGQPTLEYINCVCVGKTAAFGCVQSMHSIYILYHVKPLHSSRIGRRTQFLFANITRRFSMDWTWICHAVCARAFYPCDFFVFNSVYAIAIGAVAKYIEIYFSHFINCIKNSREQKLMNGISVGFDKRIFGEIVIDWVIWMSHAWG